MTDVNKVETSKVETNRVESLESMGLNPLTVFAGSVKSLFQMEKKDLQSFQFETIKKSFKRHFNENNFYRDACLEKNVTPDDLTSFESLQKIPLIPIAMFKSNQSHKLLTKSLLDIELEMRSTGTSGIPSISRRCGETIDQALLGIYSMYREFFEISKGAGLYLCPSTEEIPEMGMIKALNLLAGLLDTHRYMVRDERFVPEDALAQLKTWGNNFDRHIIGPPFLISRFIQYLKATNQKITLDKKSYVISLGGWKRFTGEMLSRVEFNKDCVEYLGVDESRIRDIYALVESNVVAIDDEHGVKHVSPYVHLSVRDPKNLDQELPEGETGQLALLDPISSSTPGFILTEDLVRLLPAAEGSSRGGQRLQYIMRLPESKEFGCCAVNLDERLEKSACPVV